MNRLGMPSHVKRTPIFGLGCVGGVSGIARAADAVRAWPDQVAVLLSVELCSLTIQWNDHSVRNMIASGLFGDGAAAVVLAGGGQGLPGPRVRASRASFSRDTEDLMGWDVCEQGFQIVLSADVPRVVREKLRPDVDLFLAEQGLELADIGCFVCHPGGPRVLEACQNGLDLRNGELDLTWQCLQRVGNLSSASVLMVLHETQNRGVPPGTLGLMIGMGPGFCSELVLLEW